MRSGGMGKVRNHDAFEVLAMWILILVAMLGNKDFGVRQQAEFCLERIWPISCDAVLVGCDLPDAEIRFRCLRIVDRFSVPGPMSESFYLHGQLVFVPFVDSIPNVNNRIKYIDRASIDLRNAGVETGWPCYKEYRLATRYWMECEGPQSWLVIGVMVVRTDYHDRMGHYP